MGNCLKKRCNKSETPATEAPKEAVYSWDKRRLNPADYIIENRTDEIVGRLPDSVNGQSMAIQNCSGCKIYLFDQLASITIDNCKNCQIVIGPVKSSVFLRNCVDCVVACCCGQYRTRDCRAVKSVLYCKTKPVIESSVQMRFGCFNFAYDALGAQFAAAALEPFNNNWCCVYDFTPETGEANYSLLAKVAAEQVLLWPPADSPFAQVAVSLHVDRLVLPVSLGPRDGLEKCLVIFFATANSHDEAMAFYRQMTVRHTDCELRRTVELTLSPSDMLRIADSSAYNDMAANGAAVCLEWSGEGACEKCRSVLSATGSKQSAVFVSSADKAEAALAHLYSISEMQFRSI